MSKGRASKAYSSPKLVVPREQATRRIRQQIEIGRGLRDLKMFSMGDLESAQERRTKWLEDNIEILTRLFNDPSFGEEYNAGLSLDMDSAITFSLKEQYFKEDINGQIARLESFLERLRRMPETGADGLAEQEVAEEPIRKEEPIEIGPWEARIKKGSTTDLKPREEPPKEKPLIEKLEKLLEEELLQEVPYRTELPREIPPSKTVSDQGQLPGVNVLLIHGRDEATKESISTFIEKLGLRALILHDQPDGGRSVIEKFGQSSNIHFAIILLTPDDITAPRNKAKERQVRVSQDVMFEFGYFMGKLGHGRVCVLYQEGVEIPLDYEGVVYIPMDSRGVWRFLVAKEIKQAGIEIDLNKAI
jgi:hypothetical protein